ncbi:MAG: HAMP domain-containing protein, partial [Calditrichaeota bacterium]
TQPVEKISQAALQLSQGNFSVEVPVHTRDEIGMLARAFNYMVKEIREKEHIRKMHEDLQKAYQRVESLNRSLQEANRLKSEFLSIAAHDLKNPLQVISGYAEMIEDTPELPEPVYKSSQKIHEATERMLKIISHLLDSTAIESGKLKLNISTVDLAEVTQKVIEANQPLAQQKKQRLIFSADPNTTVKGDPDRLYEVINNLVSNAIKFSPPRKPIRINVMNVANRKEFKGNVVIRVEDKGPGLTSEDLKKLFGRFARLSAQPTGGESSTGLGLSIVKQLVELHGGRVWAESKGVGKGSIFCIEL